MNRTLETEPYHVTVYFFTLGNTVFRVANVVKDDARKACELLVLVTEHFENLMVDWFPALDSQNIHGQKAVDKIGLCPECVAESIGKKDELDRTRRNGMSAEASNCNDADGERKFTKQQKGAKASSKSMYDKNTRDDTGTRTMEKPERGRSMSASSKEDSKIHARKKKGASNSGRRGSDNSATGEEEEGSTRTNRNGSLGEENEPSNTAAEVERGEEEREHSSNGGENIQVEGIQGFIVKEAMEKIDADKTIECKIHGVIEYSKIFPDLVRHISYICLPDYEF